MLSNTSMRKILYIETMETLYRLIELLSMKKGMLGSDDFFFPFYLITFNLLLSYFQVIFDEERNVRNHLFRRICFPRNFEFTR